MPEGYRIMPYYLDIHLTHGRKLHIQTSSPDVDFSTENTEDHLWAVLVDTEYGELLKVWRKRDDGSFAQLDNTRTI